MDKYLGKTAIALLLVLVAVLSFTFAGDRTSRTDTYDHTISSIDGKVDTVMKLASTSAVTSAVMSAIPGDTATPIANKLADFTECFLLILCVLYAEKYSLTIIGIAVFRIIIPLACLLGIISIFRFSPVMKRIALKLILFSLVLFLTIPVSIRVSDMIYETYSDSIEETVSSAEALAEESSELAGEEDQGIIASILDKISETATSLTKKGAAVLSNFVELLAVMIVTSCVIPLLVLLLFVWVIKLLTGIEVRMPPPPGSPARRGKKENPSIEAARPSDDEIG